MVNNIYHIPTEEISTDKLWGQYLLGEQDNSFILNKRPSTPLSWLGKIWRWIEGTYRLSSLEKKIAAEVDSLLAKVNNENQRKLEIWGKVLPKFQVEVVNKHNARAWFDYSKVMGFEGIIQKIDLSLKAKTPSTDILEGVDVLKEVVSDPQVQNKSQASEAVIAQKTPLKAAVNEASKTPVKAGTPLKTPPKSSKQLKSAIKQKLSTQATPRGDGTKTPAPISTIKQVKSVHFTPITYSPAKRRAATEKLEDISKAIVGYVCHGDLTDDENGVNGTGKVVFENGDVKEGTFVNGLLECEKGLIVKKNGSRLEGQFKNDLLVKGRLKYNTGTILEGEFENNQLFKGRQEFRNGHVYGTTGEGKFVNGRLEGFGYHINELNIRYEGFFKANKFDNGKVIELDGTVTLKSEDISSLNTPEADRQLLSSKQGKTPTHEHVRALMKARLDSLKELRDRPLTPVTPGKPISLFEGTKDDKYINYLMKLDKISSDLHEEYMNLLQLYNLAEDPNEISQLETRLSQLDFDSEIENASPETEVNLVGGDGECADISGEPGSDFQIHSSLNGIPE